MRRRKARRRLLRIGAITPASERAVQRAVLAFVLARYPAPLTFSGLASELFERPGELAAAYALARAVRDLAVVGLLESDGVIVSPTAAALRFDLLLKGMARSPTGCFLAGRGQGR